MKKYPFSKKALNAMLAATVALSPIVTTGIPFHSIKVEAATIDTASALLRVKKIISNFSQSNLATFDKAAQGIHNFDSQDWDSVLTPEVSAKLKAELAGTNVTSRDLLDKIFSLVFGANAGNFDARFTEFKASNEFREFERIMGAGTTDQLIQFFVDAEKEAWKRDPLAAMTNGTLVDLTRQIRNDLIKDPTYANLNTAFATKLGVGIQGLFDITSRIQAKLVSDGTITSTELNTLKQAFILAAFAAGNPNTPPVDPGPPPVVDPPKPPIPPEPGELPIDTYKVEDGAIIVNPDKVTEIVEKLITPQNNTIKVDLPKPAAGEEAKAQLPASLFTEAENKNANAIVEIKSENASYKLPASEINVSELAATLGVPAKDVQIVVSVNVVESTKIQDGIKVVSKVIEFSVKAVSGTNSTAITNFSTYVERSIVGDNNFDSNKSVGVKINEDGSVTPVPTLFEKNNANIESLTNSKYTVIENNITFPDVDNNKNWAEKYIETLANKLIIKGKADGTFAPGEGMTRAQFTVLLVKALGLPGEKYEQKFKDVQESDWFNANGELAAAIKLKIIQGKPDGRFAPNENITRTQAAVMLYRAMNLGFISFDMKKLDKTKLVSDFKDAAKIDSGSRLAVEALYQAGIISGKPDSTFDPNGKTKRDQMAKMLAEFLISAKLMNEIK